jgi:ribonuclease Z
MSNIFIQKCLDRGTIPLVGTPYEISGESIAARNTAIYVKGLNILLDCGKLTEQRPSYIFITHSHADHIKDLPVMLLDTPKGNVNVVVPRPELKHIKDYVESFFKMTKYSDNFDKINWNLIDVSIPKDIDGPYFMSETPIVINKKNFKIELFKCTHTIPTTGYGFIELRSKLKQEYVGLTQIELENLKKEGIDITNIIEVPLFCYLGDTTHHVFYTDVKCNLYNEHLEKYKNIITECTFIDESDIKTAKDKKHMHWKYLSKYIIDHPDINFILCHFSMKYTLKKIKLFFQTQRIPNINLLIHDFEENRYKSCFDSCEVSCSHKCELDKDIDSCEVSCSHKCELDKDIDSCEVSCSQTYELDKDMDSCDVSCSHKCELDKDMDSCDVQCSHKCELDKDMDSCDVSCSHKCELDKDMDSCDVSCSHKCDLEENNVKCTIV